MASQSLSKRRPAVDSLGERFGRLLVQGIIPAHDSIDARCKCKCDCGCEIETRLASLRSGQTTSCGCFNREKVSVGKYHLKHGESHPTPEYRAWVSMITRCHNPNTTGFKNWGGRGISVCLEWRHDYVAFLAHVGRRPSPKHSLDRYPNVNGNYEPGNVRWATSKEQARNRRANRMITCGAQTLTAPEWAERTGTPAGTISNRLRIGWDSSRAIFEPSYNTKGSTRITAKSKVLTFNGQSLTLTQWARKLGMVPRSLMARLEYGWSVDEALTTPIKKKRVFSVEVKQ